MSRIARGAMLVLGFTFVGVAPAADWSDLKQACVGRSNLGPGKHWLATCIIDFYTLEPLHPAINSIAPITGTGFGIGIDRIRRAGRVELIPTARALVSTDGSTLFRGSLTVGAPGFTQTDTLQGHPETDAKASITFYAERYDLQHQNYYGEGDFTTQSDLAIYRLRETNGGAKGDLPLANWVSVSISGDYLQPDVLGATSAGRPSIVTAYTESSAPGLSHQPGFARVKPSVQLLFKPVFAEYIQLNSAYAFYHSTDGPLYSFRQFTGSIAAQRALRFQTLHTASHRSPLSDAICTPLPAKECSLGTVTVRAFATTSQTSAGSVVPFYFQPTLGGANFDGDDTLRGFRDYRFRAPDVMGFQAELTHPIWGPVGLVGYYDAGRVALQTSDLGFEHFRHTIGVGLDIRASNIAVFRFSLGFGTHEGIIGNAKFGGGLL